MPIQPAMMVNSGNIMNSSGQPMASDRATHIQTSGSEKTVAYCTQVLCAFINFA